jgi:hypothetical protein
MLKAKENIEAAVMLIGQGYYDIGGKAKGQPWKVDI